MEMLRQLHPDEKSSMLQNVEAKMKREVEMFSGKLCLLGEQYHIPTPNEPPRSRAAGYLKF